MKKIHVFIENELGTKFSVNDFVECEENGYYGSKTYKGTIVNIDFSRDEFEIVCKSPCTYNKKISIFDLITIEHTKEG